MKTTKTTEKTYEVQELYNVEWLWYNEYTSLKEAKAGLVKAKRDWKGEKFRLIKVVKKTETTVLDPKP